MRGATWWATFSLMGALSAVYAKSPHPWLQQADASVDRILEMREQLREEFAQAVSNKQQNRADCLKRSELALDSLVELSRHARNRLALHLEEQAELDAEEQLDRIQAAVARAEQHLRQAARCGEESSLTPPRRRTTTREPGLLSPPSTAPATPWRRLLIGGRIPCLNHEGLACLVVRALALPGDGDCVQRLQQRNVAPLRGWDPPACATADDVCVVLVRALGVVVQHPDDPEEYRAALRQYGLLIETKLPPGNTTVSEPEVRELLATGFGR